MKMFLGISWGSPASAIFLVGWLCVAAMLFYRLVRQRRTTYLLAGISLNRMISGFSLSRELVKLFLLVVGFLFLCIALLRPQWDKKEEAIAQEGRDIFIALDISRSMLATDCQPDRLACAKNKIRKLLKKVECERVGLIVFSGSAFVQCPLTHDISSFMLFLDALDVETISSGNTNIRQALQTGIKAFKDAGERKNKLLLLVTDGEDFSLETSLSEIIRSAGLRVFALGVGSPTGAPIPLYSDEGKLIGHQKDEKGSVVISRLNESFLASLAQDAGGNYVRMTSDDADLNEVLKKIRQFDKERFDEQRVDRLQEQYPYFVAVSFISFLLEWMV